MDICEVPFNKLIGLARPEREEKCFVKLGASTELLNHLGTVHASAQFALAEACSGEYLIRQFKEREGRFAPVVRRVEGKFRKPASGNLFAKAAVADDELAKFIADLDSKRRATISIGVDVFDANDVVTLSAAFEWFIQRLE